MNRVTRGTVVLAAALGAISCKGDPTSDLRNGIDHLEATPSAIFLKVDSTKTVIVQAVDEQGNALGAGFSVGATTGAITVDRDQTWNAVYDSKGNLVLPSKPTSARYIINTTGNSSNASFVVSAGGKSITIPVRIVPASAPAFTLNVSTPNLGDTVIATAPADFRFTPASVISIAGGVAAVKLSLSADSSQLRFLPGPSANAAVVTISNLRPAYAPAIGTYTANSGAATLTTPAVTNFTPSYSTTTPALNDTVTMTATGFKFLPSTTVSISGRLAAVVGFAADSSSVKFVPVPATAAANPTVSGIVLSFLTSVPLTLPATAAVTPPAAGLAGTGAFATAPTIPVPAAGGKVTFLDAGGYTANATCTGDLGGPCRIYKFVVPASVKISMTITWQGTTDLGVYTYDSGGAILGSALICDSKGAGAGGQPETCSYTFPAGTYYWAVDSFSPFYAPPNNVDPTDIKIVLVGG